MYSLKLTLKSLSAALVLTSAASQAAIVLNPSFEADDIANNGFGGIALNWTITGTAGTQDFALQNPQATAGEQHAYANGGSMLTQLTSETIIGGQTYTLTVDVGQIDVFTGSIGTLRLYGSTLGAGTAIAELIGIAPTSGTYLLNQTFSYTAPAGGGSFAGQTIGIALMGQSGQQVLFDNVRFNAIPEPSTALLGGLGALALLRRRRI